MRLGRRCVSVVVLLAVAAVLQLPAGCSQAPSATSSTLAAGASKSAAATPTVDAQIDRLLRKYDLHRAAATEESTHSVPASGFWFASYIDASRAIGMDLTRFEGKPLLRENVRLQERSDGDASHPPALASFLVYRNSVVGAGLALPGYDGGVTPLSDHSVFAVTGLSPSNLDFSEVRKAEILGPWSGKDWTRRVSLDASQTARLFELLHASPRSKGARNSVEGDEEYMFILTYASGPEVRVRLFTKRGTGATFVTYDASAFEGTYFSPPSSLRPFVRSVLAGGQ